MNPLSLLQAVFQVLELNVSRQKYLYGGVLVSICIAAGFFWYFLILPPPTFFPSTSVNVDSGVSVRHEASELKTSQLIRSTFLFRVIFRLLPGNHGVQSGVYDFAEPVGELRMAWDLAYGVSEVPEVRITFPEGTTVRQMGAILAKKLPHIDEQKFDSLAIPNEGYLFPDTYFFRTDTTNEQVVSILKFNFEDHLGGLQETFNAFGKSEHDVVIMASLLEGEGKTLEDRRIIAGILWKRLSIGMPLQVDATFGYDYGKTGYVPTQADLKGNSAYNSYRYKGLPPTPINNPGEESLLASITPTKTSYLYYLTGSDGEMHYAKTFAEHIANQKKYFK